MWHFLFALEVLAATFVLLSPQDAFLYYTNSRTLPYVQSSMMQNNVPLDDSLSIVAALQWVNSQRFNDSILVAHIAFIGWARLYLNSMRAYAYSNPVEVNLGNFTAYSHVFALYWAVGRGWCDPTLLSKEVVELHMEGNVTVYSLAR